MLSCQEVGPIQNDENVCSCAIEPTKTIDVSLKSIKGELKVWQSSESDFETNNYSYSRAGRNFQARYYDILAELDLIEIFGNMAKESIRTVFYFKGNFNHDNIIDEKRLCGALCYFTDGKKLEARVFTYKGGIFNENKTLASMPKVMSTNDFQLCSNIFSPNGTISSLDLFNPANFSNYKYFYRNGFLNDFNLKIKKHFDIEGIQQKAAPPGDRNCAFPCPGNPGVCVPQEKTGGIVVDKCMFGCVYDSSKKIIEDSSSMNYSLAHGDLYMFRDSFLANNSLGEEYIDYFYFISGVIANNLSLSLSLKIMSITQNEVVPRIQMLLNNSESTDTLFDDNAREIGHDLLNDLEILSSDSLYYNYINAIRSDLDTYVNWTVKDVVDEVEGN